MPMPQEWHRQTGVNLSLSCMRRSWIVLKRAGNVWRRMRSRSAVYAYQELCQGVALRQSECFDHAVNIIKKLLPAFQKVADQDHSQAVMQNAQPIYAGLTYGRTSLNENIGVDVSVNRGFQA